MSGGTALSREWTTIVVVFHPFCHELVTSRKTSFRPKRVALFEKPLLEKIGGEKRGGQATRINSLAVSELGERASMLRSIRPRCPRKEFHLCLQSNQSLAANKGTDERAPIISRTEEWGTERRHTHVWWLFVRSTAFYSFNITATSQWSQVSGHTLSTHRGRRTSLTAFELFFDAGCLT